MRKKYNTYIVITPADFERLQSQYARMVRMLPEGKLIFVGSEGVGKLVKGCALGDRVAFIDENELLPFNDVWEVLNDHLKELLQGETVPRGGVGWYYQQFIKMQLAFSCEDEYYMTWDGDTIPCRPVNMFAEDGRPYMDNKNEYHELYFTTMGKLIPGMRKMIRASFISEHMIFQAQMMKELVAAIEANEGIPGKRYWEKILRAIEPDQIYQSAFSEFETYGTFVALRHPELYRIREWHSFRLGGQFFDPDTICERDYVWLGKDFDAISFEKGHTVREDNKNLFDNPRYQEKLTAKQMLLAAQKEFKGGYIESWGTDGGSSDPLA